MSRINLALDVVQDLHSLANSIETLASALTGDEPTGTITPAEQNKPTQQAAPTGQTVHAEQTAPAQPTNTVTSVEPKMNLVELRAFVAERSTSENRPKIKALLAQHGVNKLTELPEDQYEALKREVAAL